MFCNNYHLMGIFGKRKRKSSLESFLHWMAELYQELFKEFQVLFKWVPHFLHVINLCLKSKVLWVMGEWTDLWILLGFVNICLGVFLSLSLSLRRQIAMWGKQCSLQEAKHHLPLPHTVWDSLLTTDSLAGARIVSDDLTQSWPAR